MKNMVMRVAVVTGLVCFVSAQTLPPDPAWVFQWGDNHYGLLFEDAALSPAVKAVIRDDVQLILSYNSLANATFQNLHPSDPAYGTYDGRMALAGEMSAPDFSLCLYRIASGTNWFAVDAELGSNYIAKIALTNLQHTAVSKLAGFVQTLQNMTPENTTVLEFKQKWWNPVEETIYVPQESDDASVIRYIAMYSGLRYFQPSILSIGNVTCGGKSWLRGKIWTQSKQDPADTLQMDIVWGDGKWRFIPLDDF